MRSTRRYFLSELWDADQDNAYCVRPRYTSRMRQTTISFEKQKELEERRKQSRQERQKKHPLKHIRMALLLKKPDYTALNDQASDFVERFAPTERNRWIEVSPIQPKFQSAIKPQRTSSISSRNSRLPSVAHSLNRSCRLSPPSIQHSQFMQPKPRVMFSRMEPKQSVLLNNTQWTME